MPLCKVQGQTDLTYYLLSFTAEGDERADDPHVPSGMLSAEIGKVLETSSITDLFLMGHGWKGDVPAALEQYGRWIGAMAECTEDLKIVSQSRPNFTPLLVGVHWPSLPWGDEHIDRIDTSYSAGEH